MQGPDCASDEQETVGGGREAIHLRAASYRCEEQSDEAISLFEQLTERDYFTLLAMRELIVEFTHLKSDSLPCMPLGKACFLNILGHVGPSVALQVARISVQHSTTGLNPESPV